MADLRVRSEIAGSVWKIEVAVGDTVAEDDPLVILESMKMEIPLLAPRSGIVKEILVAEGEPIAEGDVAVILGMTLRFMLMRRAQRYCGAERQWRGRAGRRGNRGGRRGACRGGGARRTGPRAVSAFETREPAPGERAAVAGRGLAGRAGARSRSRNPAGAARRRGRREAPAISARNGSASAIGWTRTAARFRRCASDGFSCMARIGPRTDRRGAARRDPARNRRGDRVRHRRASLDAQAFCWRSTGSRADAASAGRSISAPAPACWRSPPQSGCTATCWRATSIAPPCGSPRTMSGATVCAGRCA